MTATTVLTRSSVYSLGGPWAAPLLWYARGVQAMQARALAEPTGWRFYGAIHGFDATAWQQVGYFTPGEPMPSDALQQQFWNQCQHGSWFFLPWHRGYVLALEANVRAEVVALGGPADWSLPYWNYFNLPNQNQLPVEFASPDWPDGKGNNPLYIVARWGPNSDGNVYVPLNQVNLIEMGDPDFTGPGGGGSAGFGGVDTGFSHSGQTHGGIETQPHDWVHGLVGGGDPQNQNIPGLMSDPDTAGLDPIFWLHHANIDRLWAVWRQNPPTDADPTDPNWVNGPPNTGERAFSMPMPDGTTWTYTPGEMADTIALGYVYDDLSPQPAGPTVTERITRLGMTASAKLTEGAAMPREDNVELLGANRESLSIQGDAVTTAVQLDSGVRKSVSASLSAESLVTSPDRVFLNLENVRGLVDSTAFHVFVDAPAVVGASNQSQLAGSIALFGVRKASQADGEHAGQGLTYVLEITNIVDALHLNNAFDVASLTVRIVPTKPVPAEAKISIGRVSIFRQGR